MMTVSIFRKLTTMSFFLMMVLSAAASHSRNKFNILTPPQKSSSNILTPIQQPSSNILTHIQQPSSNILTPPHQSSNSPRSKLLQRLLAQPVLEPKPNLGNPNFAQECSVGYFKDHMNLELLSDSLLTLLKKGISKREIINKVLNTVENYLPTITLEVVYPNPWEKYEVRVSIMPDATVNDLLQQADMDYSLNHHQNDINPFKVSYSKSGDCYVVATTRQSDSQYWIIQVFDSNGKVKYSNRCVPRLRDVSILEGYRVKLKLISSTSQP